MKYKLEVVLRTAKTRGLLSSIYLSCLIVRSKLVGQHRPVFGFAVSASGIASAHEISGYEIELVRPGQEHSLLTELSQCRQPFDWDIKTKLKEGADVWIGRLDGRLATIAVTKTGDKKPAYFFPLAPDCVVISHCITFRSCRGLGLYPASLVQIVDVLAKKGINRFYVDCADWNTPSINDIRHAGFQLIGQAIVSKSGRLIWHQKSRPDFSYANSNEDS